ncbi:MAG: sel1 repeat family protein [Eubacterium sp.]|nr:sel1 repeat family protein [Eubacterium sp.]
MTVQGKKLLDDEKALEILNKIMESDLADCYKNAIARYADERGELNPDDVFAIASDVAFCNPAEDIPEIARELVTLAFLDEISNENPDAMLNLGSLFYTGRIGEQSYAEAVKYYKMAVEYGNMIASENLGYCYYYGRDVEIDYKTAYHYFIKPALSGRLESLYKIGDMYAKGLYVEKDENFAFSLYEKAYQGIDEFCDVVGDICLRMGNCFYYGTGCERDVEAALFFYQRSELYYYSQLKNGDFYKKKMLEDVIKKIDEIRIELKSEIAPEEFID